MTDSMRTGNFQPMTLRQAMDRLFEQSFTPFPTTWGNERPATLGMPVNIYEGNDGYTVLVAVPGLNPEDADITGQNDVIVITGEIRPLDQEGFKPIYREIPSGTFRREIRLPGEADIGKAQATYENGLLTLNVPKAEHSRPRKITVKSNGTKK
ncbi:MAG TPA: Hsp20/alpha crystallin family protein [Chloroflexota bacterium]|nr:Hsp20/alpha crystallin family protein [Chloroflexota bacterium]